MPPSIRQRVASWFLRDNVRELQAKARILDKAFQWQPWLSANPSVLKELLMDAETLDFLTMQLSWESLSGQYADDESHRIQAVNLARYYYRSDPTVWRCIRIITDFSIGRTIKVTCADPKAQPVWDAFWTNPANRVLLSTQAIKKMSDIWLCDGEFVPVHFTSKLDGEVRVRRFPTEQIVEIITDPDDADAPILYKRIWTPTTNGAAAGQSTLYYKDWRASDKDVRKVLPQGMQLAGDANTEISVMLGTVNTIGQRGWPWASRALPWAEIYSNYMKDRAAVASSVALWVREMKVKGGGSKGVEALRDILRSTLSTGDVETNPPPAAGSTLVTNSAVDTIEKPLTTGAGDARADSLSFALMAGGGANIAPMWLGHAESTANYATAQIVAQPMYEMFAGYGESWRGLVQDMVDLVLTAWEKYGRADGFREAVQFESHEAAVFLGVPSNVPFEVMMQALGTLGQLGLPAPAVFDLALKHPAFGLEDPKAFLDGYAPKPSETPVAAEPTATDKTEEPERSAQGTGQGAEPETEEPAQEQAPTVAESVALLEAAARVLAGESFEEGGPGSGNYGHAGIPGYQGGSVPTKNADTPFATKHDIGVAYSNTPQAKSARDRWIAARGHKPDTEAEGPDVGPERGGKAEPQEPAEPASTSVPVPVFKSNVEAEQWVKDNLGTEFVSFKGFDKDVTQEIVQSVADARAEFPEAFASLKGLGNNREFRTVSRAETMQHAQEWAQRVWPNDPGQQKRFLSQKARQGAFKMPPNTWAAAYHDPGKGRYLFFNQEAVSSGAKLKVELSNAAKTGWHPEGCDTVKSICDHEMAHVISGHYRVFGKPEWKEMATAKTADGQYKYKPVSKYAKKDDAEFVAEAWAEYKNSKNPSATAKAVAKMMRKGRG